MERLVSAIVLMVLLALPAATLAQPLDASALLAQSGANAQMAAGWVSIADFAFQPDGVYVAPGGTVTWSNIGAAPHTVTSTAGAFDSGAIGSGGGSSLTFQTVGTYSYYCAIHPSMTGSIIVS